MALANDARPGSGGAARRGGTRGPAGAAHGQAQDDEQLLRGTGEEQAPPHPPSADTPRNAQHPPNAQHLRSAQAPQSAQDSRAVPDPQPAGAPGSGAGAAGHTNREGGPSPSDRGTSSAPGTPSAPSPAAGSPVSRHTTPWPEARAAARAAGVSRADRPASAHRPGQVPAAARDPEAPALAPLPAALGRVLAAPLTALTDLPSFDTSAMDGWAVAGPGPWRALPDGVLAGQERPEPLGDGEAVRIATGARIPRDTTAVIRSEHAHVDDKGHLYARHDVVPGQDIRPRAQECRNGDRLLPRGTLVTPAVLGLAAAAGYDTLPVAPRPTVEVLVLGDELLTSGLPHEGRIRDVLGPMLPPWLTALGADVTAVRRLGDDADTLYAALARSTADVLVTTGGTASGPVDHVHPALRHLGAELLVDGVAVRPGHPMLLARLPATPGTSPGQAPLGPQAPHGSQASPRHLVGLPGNPLAAVSGLLTLAAPLLRGLAGRPAVEPYAMPLRDDVQGHPRDTRLVPVSMRGPYAVPLHYNGPAMLRGIAVADGLAVVRPGGARRHQEVEILDLPWGEARGQYGELSSGGPNGPFNEVCFT
ncbi:molybdopterin-binding protein [Streptomyces sp. CC224B]|uniref:molybdopterin molybdotransferase MoeA n=1 Tax=Streptomyces sp. CC224B TaxID=3044571 RepID=UPI0024A96C94|nr:molybdopterin-binding protein [Streptomyces sp. CC224B]